MTNFERLTKNIESLAEYLLENCENPIDEENSCNLCPLDANSEDCNEDACKANLEKWLENRNYERITNSVETLADYILNVSDYNAKPIADICDY